MGRFAYVDVEFTAADTDTDIAHTLKPGRPDNVRWLVVSRDADVAVYRDGSATALPWQDTFIWLRSTAAANVRLLLFIEPNEE